MNQREIPGFYFDREKQKYFRIQKNHVLPAGSAHTRASVKVIKEAEEKERRRIKFENRIRLTKVTRSRFSNLPNVLVLRLGSKPTSQAQKKIAEIYAQNLSSQTITLDNTHVTQRDQAILEYSGFGISDDGCIVSSDTRGRYFVGIKPTNQAYTYPQLDQQWGSGFSAGIQPRGVHRLIATVDDCFVGVNEQHTHVSIGRFSNGTTTQMRTSRLIEDQQVWDIVGSHTSSGPLFAMAVDDGICLLEIHPSGTVLTPMYRGYNQCEQMAVAFKERDVIMSGERRGRVFLTDVRSPDSTVVRLQHSSAVSCLSATKNQSEILVQGFSTMSVYDLRYNKALLPNQRSSFKKIRLSKPCLEIAMPTDRQSDQYIVGGRKMAYFSDLDLIVAASCRSNPQQAVNPYANHVKINRVTLYSAKTGRTVPSPINDHVFNDPVTCLDLKRIRDGPESIITLDGGKLLEWTIHGERDDGFDKSGVKSQTSGKAAPYGGQMNIVKEWERGNRGPV